MDVKNKSILVLGLGKSGLEVINFLSNYNANIFLFDDNEDVLNEIVFKYGYKKYSIGMQIDFAVISPGISKFHFMVKELNKLNIDIISELELAYNYSKGDLIAVTGTNGKTTTVSLIGEILKSYTENYYVLGNIGLPYISKVDEICDDSITCLEVSSFQLEFIKNFRSNISIILNLQPDHLDRYYNELDYYSTKLCIYKNCGTQDYVILNFDDNNIINLTSNIKCRKLYISLYNEVYGIYYKDGEIYINLNSFKYKISTEHIKLYGRHNLYNVMASVLSTYLLGIPIDLIVDQIYKFKGLPHRMQFIKEVSGVKFINDSKATNIASCLTAIKSMDNYIHVLIGGSDKGEDFNSLFNNINNKDNITFYFFGGNSESIYNIAKNYYTDNKIYKVDNLYEAVNLSYIYSNEGDTILLSPACASFDKYKNYEERGKHFIDIVRSLNAKK